MDKYGLSQYTFLQVCVDNLGQMDVRQTDLTLGCGTFAGLGILMDEKTTIFVTDGELQVTPASFQNSYQKVVVGQGGILGLRNGTYPNNVDITLENDGELHIPGKLVKTFDGFCKKYTIIPTSRVMML